MAAYALVVIVTFLVGILVGRRGRRRFERVADEAEEGFALLAEHARATTFVRLDQRGRIVSWNAGAQRLLGWSAAEALERDVSLFFVEPARAQQALGIARSSGRFTEQDHRVRKDGARFWAELSIQRLERGGFALFVEDASERAQAEKERVDLLVRERDARTSADDSRMALEAIVMNAPVAIALQSGPDHVYSLANASFRKLVGNGDPTGRAAADCAPAFLGSRERWLAVLDRVRATGEAYRGEEVTVLERDAFYTVVVCPMGATGLATFALDVSDLVRARKAVESSIRARDEFLSVASHALRTPLTSLKIVVRSLSRKDSAGERPKLDAIDADVSRLAQLVEEVLEVSRIASGRLELVREDVDLVAIVNEVVRKLEPECMKVDCKLSLHLPAHPVVGRWDRQRITDVATKLLSNAMKYGARAPIEIRVTEASGTVRLSVRDHGIGIAPEDQARIFERFERAVPDTHYGGLGLGLWVVRQYVDAHGGRVLVESRKGEGSVFHAEFPLAENSTHTVHV